MRALSLWCARGGRDSLVEIYNFPIDTRVAVAAWSNCDETYIFQTVIARGWIHLFTGDCLEKKLTGGSGSLQMGVVHFTDTCHVGHIHTHRAINEFVQSLCSRRRFTFVSITKNMLLEVRLCDACMRRHAQRIEREKCTVWKQAGRQANRREAGMLFSRLAGHRLYSRQVFHCSVIWNSFRVFLSLSLASLCASSLAGGSGTWHTAAPQKVIPAGLYPLHPLLEKHSRTTVCVCRNVK